MKGDQDKMGNKSGSGSGAAGSSRDQPGGSQEKGQPAIQHTNAGNTGTGSGQISPSTQHAAGTGKSFGSSQGSSSGTDRDR
jgi:hypothetical protein